MRFFSARVAIMTGCLILAVAFLAPPSTHGDEWNLATRFTVNQPFQVPGMVLQPSTPYVIRLLDSPSNRNVVQIYNEDQTKMLTMFMGISDERMEPADRTTFTFIEMAPGFPLPVKEWFYPGRLNGLEFVYPKEQATNIAQHAREPILSASSGDLRHLNTVSVEAIGPITEPAPVAATASNVTESAAPAPAAPVEETPNVAELTPPQSNEQQPAPAVEQPSESQNVEPPAQIAQNTEPAAPAATTTPAPQETRELPRTAGELPLVGVIGLLCLGVGLGLRVFSEKA